MKIRAQQSKRKETYWKKHLEAWEASGESQARYCLSQNLKICQFHYWKRKLQAEKSAEFRLVTIEPEERTEANGRSEAGIRIVWQGLVVEVHEGFDAGGLKTVLEVLGEMACGA